MQKLVVQRVPFGLTAVTFGQPPRRLAVPARLEIERADQRVWIEEQLEDRVQQAADGTQQTAARLVERRVLERVAQLGGVGRVGCGGGAPALRRSSSSSPGLIDRGSRIASRRRAASS